MGISRKASKEVIKITGGKRNFPRTGKGSGGYGTGKDGAGGQRGGPGPRTGGRGK